MIHELKKPLPVTTPLGNGWVWYVKDNGMFENDEVTVIMFDGGEVKHFTTAQIKAWHNETYDIKKSEFKF
jgi:hypothetical protein